MITPPVHRRLRTAELLAVGSELTNGETRDSNGGELARSLAAAGVAVRRITALPDDLALVVAAFREALATSDLVVSTGGLGPTPDDLTREALAAAAGQTPAIDPGLEAWLRDLFARRGSALPEVNLKQAWLIPSATAIPNPNGTAPGWWVDRPDGRVAVLLPGPPREMRPMWTEWVLPRLRGRGLGDDRAVRVLRTYGIGESAVVELLGDALFRTPNPVVATYARAEWLDLRISAVDEPAAGGAPGRPAAAIVAEAEATIRATLGGFVWAEGETTWGEVVAAAAGGRTFATIEWGTGGALAALLADVAELARAEIRREPPDEDGGRGPGAIAEAAALTAGVPVGLAVSVVRPDGTLALVDAVVAVRTGTSVAHHRLELRLFARGAHGQLRGAIAAAAFLAQVLRGEVPPDP